MVTLLVSLLGSTLQVTPVHAAGIVVNSSADAVVNNDGKCTLREAILAAVNDAPSGTAIGEFVAGSETGMDTISFRDSYIITVGSQLPYINNPPAKLNNSITVIGGGASNTIIQAAAEPNVATWRVFQVTPTGNLTLDGLTVRNGQCNGSCTTVGGIDPNSGGGIYNSGTLTIKNSTISANQSSIDGEGGGGIYNSGTLVITNSTISENRAYTAASIFNRGTLSVADSTIYKNDGGDGAGGIENHNGSVTVTDSSFLNNTSTAIFSWSGVLSVTDSTFSGNSAYGQGAGIESDGSATVINSTFSENSSNSFGGGISNGGDKVVENSTFVNNDAGTWAGGSDGWGGGIYNRGTLTVVNSTFSHNLAFAHGGGISNSGQLTVTNSTIIGNRTPNDGGGIYNDETSTVILRNTIIADSDGGNCYGTITNEGNNLDSGTSCGWGSSNGSMSNTDPLLGWLADNGGSTETMALQPGSPAINAGNDATCPATDQRGISRPQGSHCDIGSYEYIRPTINYTISGTTGLAGVVLSYTDETPRTVTSQADGRYTITVPSGWNGTMQPGLIS